VKESEQAKKPGTFPRDFLKRLCKKFNSLKPVKKLRNTNHKKQLQKNRKHDK